MITLLYCQSMARYSTWMNAKLLAACSELSDRELKRDRLVFFGSNHGTWNHLIYGDLDWLSRFVGDENAVPALGTEPNHRNSVRPL